MAANVDPKVVEAAERLRQDFLDAKDGNYYKNGWYARMRKWDIERLVEHVIGPYPPEQCSCDPGMGVVLNVENRRIVCERCKGQVTLTARHLEELKEAT